MECWSAVDSDNNPHEVLSRVVAHAKKPFKKTRGKLYVATRLDAPDGSILPVTDFVLFIEIGSTIRDDINERVKEVEKDLGIELQLIDYTAAEYHYETIEALVLCDLLPFRVNDPRPGGRVPKEIFRTTHNIVRQTIQRWTEFVQRDGLYASTGRVTGLWNYVLNERERVNLRLWSEPIINMTHYTRWVTAAILIALLPSEEIAEYERQSSGAEGLSHPPCPQPRGPARSRNLHEPKDLAGQPRLHSGVLEAPVESRLLYQLHVVYLAVLFCCLPSVHTFSVINRFTSVRCEARRLDSFLLHGLFGDFFGYPLLVKTVNRTSEDQVSGI